ncbi:hypothetical protein L1987_76364 [Smallanthus sonchifolius]|uniref:Uncharacterized protein n=1 Tax=Smallanthus sonchifolius TaxID=185202 RepID=A0ACB9A8B7_9ASTR|nr:hypothetical protein L1987_76364 [Smallanthus sonchifolius]
MLLNSFHILTFDLRTEKFSKISTPDDVANHGFNPRIIKINGCVGVVCQVDSNVMNIWLLQDYENRVWVRETVTFPEPWIELDGPFPIESVNMDEIIFFSTRLAWNTLSVHVYNMKSRCFRSVQLTLNQPFLCLNDVEFDQIKCYGESIAEECFIAFRLDNWADQNFSKGLFPALYALESKKNCRVSTYLSRF